MCGAIQLFLDGSSEDAVHCVYPGICTTPPWAPVLPPAVPRSRQIHPQGSPTRADRGLNAHIPL
jgi:hypothetical protein